MERRRFVISLADDELSQELRNTNFQIVFTLIPSQFHGKLFDTVHPVAWKVFDLREEYMTVECGRDLGACTATKKSDSTVHPGASRVIPRGHYSALKLQGSLPQWTRAAQWNEDILNAVVALNDSETSQALAICSTSTTEDSWEPVFSPIMLYNKMKKGSMVRVGCSLILKAYYGRNFQSKRQIHVNEADLEPILDEQCEPWSQPLDGLPWVTALQIRRTQSGAIRIERVPDEDVDLSGRKVRRELDAVRTALQTIQIQTTSAAPQLREFKHQMQDILDQIARLDGQVSGTKNGLEATNDDLKGVNQNVTKLQGQVRDCIRDLEASRLLKPPQRSGGMSDEDLDKMQVDLERIDRDLVALKDSVRPIPSMQTSINKLTRTTQDVFQTIDQNAQDTDRRIVLMGTRVGVLETSSQDQESKLGTLNEYAQSQQGSQEHHRQIESKLSNDIAKLQSASMHYTARLGQVSESSTALKGRLDLVDTRFTSIEGRLSTFAPATVSMTIEGVSKRVDGIDKSIRKLEENDKVLGTSVTNLREKTEAGTAQLRASIADVQKFAQDTRTRDAAIKGDPGAVTKMMKKFETRVERTEADVKGLNKKVETIDSATREVSRGLKEVKGRTIWSSELWHRNK